MFQATFLLINWIRIIDNEIEISVGLIALKFSCTYISLAKSHKWHNTIIN